MKKRLLTAIALFCLAMHAMAQPEVAFMVSGGLQDASVKQRVEKNITALLSEINRANAQDRSLLLDKIDMDPSGKKSLQHLWNNLHFFNEDNEIRERCLNSVEGYVVRNIYIRVEPRVKNYTDELERSLVIRLTRSGQIASVVMAASDHDYDRIVRKGMGVTDMERRQTILSFVENFRSHYDEKDLKALNQVFSDEALIITGTVVAKYDNSSDQPRLKPEIVYHTQNKKQYLTNLDKVFKSNKYVKVTFKDIELVRHPTNPDFYAVTLKQHWESSNYSDDGYLVLLWEFSDDRDPIIHVRTWQPNKVGSRELAQDEVINIRDFTIPKRKPKHKPAPAAADSNDDNSDKRKILKP